MKRLLLFSILGLSLLAAQAQCTPDPAATLPQFNPIATDTLIATLNMPYSQVFTVNVPADTTITTPLGSQTIAFAKQTLVSIDSMAPGLNYACNTNGCTWLGATSGCFLMSGTPTAAGIYRMRMNTNLKMAQALPIIGDNFNVPYPYIMKVVGPTALEDVLDVNNFRFAPCQPSPAKDMTTLKFTYPRNKDLEMSVIDLAGKTVLSQTLSANSGLNSHELNVQSLTTGIYFITLNDGNRVLKQKLVVN
jgi:Secretion system C-terminal sorting domain